jgi:hypothetical protein
VKFEEPRRSLNEVAVKNRREKHGKYSKAIAKQIMCVNHTTKNAGARSVDSRLSNSSDDVESVFISDFLAQGVQYTRKSFQSMVEIARRAESSVSYK